jgi:hypothetical protein
MGGPKLSIPMSDYSLGIEADADFSALGHPGQPHSVTEFCSVFSQAM